MKNQANSPNLIYESKDYLIANKSCGQLIQSSQDSSDDNLHDILEKSTKSKLHILTRIDRPVSGLCLFSGNSDFNKHFLKEQVDNKVEKKYLALVEGQLELKDSVQIHYGQHNRKTHKMYIRTEPSNSAHKMESTMNTLLLLDRYSLIEIIIHRGKFHQIRSQCSFLGYPIKGDVKYGARRANKNRQIHLHSSSIKLKLPNSQEVYYQAELPKNDDLWILVSEKLKNTDG
jgi:23S rRNA pseudouridine1911/1915/1917 synthase